MVAVINGFLETLSFFVCKTSFLTLDTPFEIRGRIDYGGDLALGMDFAGHWHIIGIDLFGLRWFAFCLPLLFGFAQFFDDCRDFFFWHFSQSGDLGIGCLDMP